MGGKTTQKNDNSIDPWSKAQYTEGRGRVTTALDSSQFKPYTGEFVSPLNPMETEAADYFKSNMGAGAGLIDEASQVAREAGGYQPIMLDASRESYMNPYTSDVIDASLSDLERSRSMAINEGQAAATMAGAFGGSRHGVADSLTNEAALRAAASTAAGLRSAGFDKASAYSLDAGRSNQAADLAGAGVRTQGGGLLADLGRTQSDMMTKEAFALAAFGEAARGVDQATLDAAYNEFLRAQDDPYKRAQMELGLLGVTPIIQDSTTVQKTSPGVAGILGTALQAGGMLSGMGLFGSAAAKKVA